MYSLGTFHFRYRSTVTYPSYAMGSDYVPVTQLISLDFLLRSVLPVFFYDLS